MKQKKIKFLLIQIDEAHSTAWPIGLINTPQPQKSFEDRCSRANDFVKTTNPTESFIIKIDGWNNEFAETFRAWPDKYYLIDSQYKIIAKSEYGAKKDALINTDCCDLICKLIKK